MKKNKCGKTIIFLLGILILIQVVAAGITHPLPVELNLLQGESGRFKFQIQTVASDQALVCEAYADGESLFDLTFDQESIDVPADSIKEVYGTVKVPSDFALGTYEESFCVSCAPAKGAAGNAVKVDTCDLPVRINVVAKRGRENLFVPEKPISIFVIILIIFVIIMIFAFIMFYLWPKILAKRMKRKTRKNNGKNIWKKSKKKIGKNKKR